MPPSISHETYVELFRTNPALARELLRIFANVAFEGRVEASSNDLSQLAPTEFRCDAVVLVRDVRDEPLAAVVVEVQLSNDPDKRWSWPVYVAATRARHRCPTYLVVIAPDAAVARWATMPIELGNAGSSISPLVINADSMQRLTVDDVRRTPELAICAAFARQDETSIRLAGVALRALPREQAQLYFVVLSSHLPDESRTLLEAEMWNYDHCEYKEEEELPGIRKVFHRGREEGREEGRVAMCRAARLLAVAKVGNLSAELEARIAALDEQRATELIVALGNASTSDEARRVLDAG